MHSDYENGERTGYVSFSENSVGAEQEESRRAHAGWLSIWKENERQLMQHVERRTAAYDAIPSTYTPSRTWAQPRWWIFNLSRNAIGKRCFWRLALCRKTTYSSAWSSPGYDIAVVDALIDFKEA